MDKRNCRGVGAYTKQSGMTKRHQSRMAEQHIVAYGEQRIDKTLGEHICVELDPKHGEKGKGHDYQKKSDAFD